MTKSKPKPPKLPQAPKHLSREAAKWWRAVVVEYVLDESDLKLLQCACEAWDRMAEARATIAHDGMTYVDRAGCPRKHPAVQIEIDNRTSFARCLRELALNDIEPPESRPPGIGRRR